MEVRSTEGLGSALVTGGRNWTEHRPALKPTVAPAPAQPGRYEPIVRGRRNHKLTGRPRLADASKDEFAETDIIHLRATRQRHPSFDELLAEASRQFDALCAAFNLLTFMRAWFDGLGWFKLLARCAA